MDFVKTFMKMKMKTLNVELTLKTAKYMGLTKNSMRMETLSLEVTLKTVLNMDFMKSFMKMKMKTLS
jgi:hypothetical protein